MVVSRSLGVAGPTAQRQVLIPFLGASGHEMRMVIAPVHAFDDLT